MLKCIFVRFDSFLVNTKQKQQHETWVSGEQQSTKPYHIRVDPNSVLRSRDPRSSTWEAVVQPPAIVKRLHLDLELPRVVRNSYLELVSCQKTEINTKKHEVGTRHGYFLSFRQWMWTKCQQESCKSWPTIMKLELGYIFPPFSCYCWFGHNSHRLACQFASQALTCSLYGFFD